MKTRKTKFLIYFIAFFLTFIINACMTGTSYFSPEFTSNEIVVFDEIKAISQCEYVNFIASSTTNMGNKVISTELDLIIVKAKNISNSEEDLKKMAKQISIKAKQALKDPNQFANYKVKFTNDNTTDSKVNANSKVFSFKAQEL